MAGRWASRRHGGGYATMRFVVKSRHRGKDFKAAEKPAIVWKEMTPLQRAMSVLGRRLKDCGPLGYMIDGKPATVFDVLKAGGQA